MKAAVRRLRESAARYGYASDFTQHEEPMSTTDLTVSTTILAQLGGQRFIAMTGAKTLTGYPDKLVFRVNGRNGKNRLTVNVVEIRLDPSDTYTVTVSYARAGKLTEIESVSDVYVDALRATFERLTGLYTRL